MGREGQTMPNTQTSITQTTDAEPFSLTRYLVSNRSTGPIAHIAECIYRHANLMPVTLAPNMAEFAIDVAKTAPTQVIARAAAAIWMPTRRLFVEFPDGTGTVGVFAEMKEDTAFEVSRIRWDGRRVRHIPYVTRVIPAEPRPEVDWDAIQEKRWSGDGSDYVWANWLSTNIKVISRKSPAEARLWAKQVMFLDLFVVAMSLAIFGRRRLRMTLENDVEVIMAPGHK
jgi:hypothetical protein